MNNDIKQIIDQEIEDMKQESYYQLKINLETQYIYEDINFADISLKKKDESKKNYIHRVISENPIYILNNLIYDIKTYKEQVSIDICPINIINTMEDRVCIRDRVCIPNIKYLTGIKDFTVRVYSIVTGEYIESEEKFEIEFINYFASEIVIYGEFAIDSNSIDDCRVKIQIEYYGLSKECHIPLWLELMLQGTLYNEMNNKEMAVFYYFVSFDSFIQNIYNQIHKIYCIKKVQGNIDNDICEYVNEEIREQLIDVVSDYLYCDTDFMDLLSDKSIQHDELSDKQHDELINDMLYDYADEIVDNYMSVSKNMELWEMEIFDNEVYEYYKSKMIQLETIYKKYARQNRRLIKEKLKDIEYVTKLNLNCKEYSGLSRLKKEIKRVEMIRNDIAHGNRLRMQIKGDEFYTIITYILSLVIQKDLDKDCWAEFEVLDK